MRRNLKSVRNRTECGGAQIAVRPHATVAVFGVRRALARCVCVCSLGALCLHTVDATPISCKVSRHRCDAMLAKTDLSWMERGTAATRILLTATLRWPISSRLALSFAKIGCQVHVLCPREHPSSRTRAVDRIRHCATLMPWRSLRAAIEAAAPDLIIRFHDRSLDRSRLHDRHVSGRVAKGSRQFLFAFGLSRRAEGGVRTRP
jgi:hypothetical protein